MFLKDRLDVQEDSKRIFYRDLSSINRYQAEIVVVDNISLETYFQTINSIPSNDPITVEAFTAVKGLSRTHLYGSGKTRPKILFSDGAISCIREEDGVDTFSTVTGTYIGWSGENASSGRFDPEELIKTKSSYYLQTSRPKGDLDKIVRKNDLKNILLKCSWR